MKRPFATVGLVYLCVTAVVFYYYSNWLLAAICIAAAGLIAVSVVAKLWRSKSWWRYGLMTGIAALAAVMSIFLYTNFVVNPILDNADAQITFEGYICEDLSFHNQYATAIVQTETIDGEDCRAKISLTMREGGELKPFDRVSGTVTPTESVYPYQLSRGIYLSAFQGSALKKRGGTHWSPYAYALSARGMMKRNLDAMLDNNAAPLAKAVLLGNKKALDSDIRSAFTQTGTSYLIVVSGMHLAVLTLLLRRFLQRLYVNEWVSLVIVGVFVTAFAAVTGFAPSVMRAGIMLMITYSGKLFFRDAEGINSLGIAALALTVPNPYIVGDGGMLLSFAATAGVVLWSEKLTKYAIHLFRLEDDAIPSWKRTFALDCIALVKRVGRRFVGFVCVSLAATLWVFPLSVLLYESISPMTVVISIFAYPLTCAVLMLSVPVALLGGIPVLKMAAIPFAYVVNFAARCLVALVTWSSTLPLAHITADKAFYYIWLAVTVCLVAVGYLIKAGKTYVGAAIVISALTLSFGGAAEYLLADDTSSFLLMRVGSGYSAAVMNREHISLLSCGGKSSGKESLFSEIRQRHRIDNIIIPSKKKENMQYFPDIHNQFDVSNILVYDSNRNNEVFSDSSFFSDGTAFTLALNESVSVKVCAVRGRVYQLVLSDKLSVLLVPAAARLSDIPDDMRHPSYAVLEGSVKNLELLDCQNVMTVSNITADENIALIDSGQCFCAALE